MILIKRLTKSTLTDFQYKHKMIQLYLECYLTSSSWQLNWVNHIFLSKLLQYNIFFKIFIVNKIILSYSPIMTNVVFYSYFILCFTYLLTSFLLNYIKKSSSLYTFITPPLFYLYFYRINYNKRISSLKLNWQWSSVIYLK